MFEKEEINIGYLRVKLTYLSPTVSTLDVCIYLGIKSTNRLVSDSIQSLGSSYGAKITVKMILMSYLFRISIISVHKRLV